MADSSDNVGAYEEFLDIAKLSLVRQGSLLTSDVGDARDLPGGALSSLAKLGPDQPRRGPSGRARRVLHNLTTDHWRRRRGRRLVPLTSQSQGNNRVSPQRRFRDWPNSASAPSYRPGRVEQAELNSAADRGRFEQGRRRLSQSPRWLLVEPYPS